jgi:hypothetical protein
MTLTALSFPARIRRPEPAIARDYAGRDMAMERYHAGDAEGALAATLRFLLPAEEIGDLRSAPVTVTHGSARITLSVTGHTFEAASALARLPASAKTTALLRHMLTGIGSTGQFYQPRLEGDVLYLRYREAIALLHPAKLIEVVERLAQEADRNDHWLIDRFGVELIDRAPVQPLTDAELRAAALFWTDHWRAMEVLLNEVRRRRSTLLLDAACSISIRHPQYQLPLYGEVRHALEEDEALCNDLDADPDRRVAALARTVKAMRLVPGEALAASLGHATYAIPSYNTGRPALIGATFDGPLWSAIGNARASGRSMEAALALISGLVTLASRHSWNEPLAQALRQGLDLAHARPFREAAEALWAYVGGLRREYGEKEESGHAADGSFDDFADEEHHHAD